MRLVLWTSIWLRRLLVMALLFAVAVGAPIAYVETQCKGTPRANDFASLLPEDARRDESRTYTTYPEWHIVHAYEDYAQVVSQGDPHDFRFIPAITGFWTSLCPLAERAAEHGGFTSDQKQTIYTIGASFTGEMLLKAAYEETVGRIATMVRGEDRAALDDLSARQAADYAAFLRQTPWYKWDFNADAGALLAAEPATPRDWERAIALNGEYRAKALYAGVIERAVAAVGADELTLRSIVTDIDPETLAGIEGVTVIGPRGDGIEIETPRYRAFTEIALALAAAGGDFLEIAGNDDILVTVLSPRDTLNGALHSFPRQGFRDYRHLVDANVWALGSRLRQYAEEGITVEHIHDY